MAFFCSAATLDWLVRTYVCPEFPKVQKELVILTYLFVKHLLDEK